jgi:short-chain fatty acids transporter
LPRFALRSTGPLAHTAQATSLVPEQTMETTTPTAASASSALARTALRLSAWAERWFPDAYVFAALAVVIVALGALALRASPTDVAVAFGEGFWSLIPFTMQMAFIVIGGYVVATAPIVAKLIDRLAAWPRNGRGAVAFVALISMLASLLNWGFSLVFGGLLVRALARRDELKMDYRAAGAAAYLGLGATWAMGLSSSAAQLQANPASIPKPLLAITGVIPFTETIFLWQSIGLTVILFVVSMLIAWWSAPGENEAQTAGSYIEKETVVMRTLPQFRRPSDWFERSPLLSILIALLGLGWLAHEFATKAWYVAIASLNTYNFIFLMAGLLLHWRPRSFLDAVARAVPSTTGVLIQFPLYGGIATILTTAKGAGGQTVAQELSSLFVRLASTDTYALVIGIYSAILGFFVPSGGGKWVIEAPYVMQAANDLHYHLGWAVQIYNAAEALPNLINPFWMLPLLGVLGLKARDIVGFTFLQLLVHLPLVLILLWAFGLTLEYHPPVMP